jgi:basic membrane protein A
VEKKLRVETAFLESVPEADSERAIATFARRGHSPVFTPSYGYMDATLAVAQKYPRTIFMHCSGFKRAENVGTYFGRMYQARYLSGLVAGAVTRSGLIGYVAAFPITEVIRGINAFTLGVREVNPQAQVRVVWVNSWIDGPAGKEAAKALLAVGADVLSQHFEPPTPQEAAAAAGKHYIGYASDMGRLAPAATLTSVVWNWEPIYLDVIQKALDGTWKSSDYWWGLDKGVIGLAPFGPAVPDKAKALVKAREAALKSGHDHVFTGPVQAQDGTDLVPAGQVASDEALLAMTKFVAGVVGTTK